MKIKLPSVLGSLLVVLSLSSCFPPSKYVASDSEQGVGYFETPWDSNEYVVSYHGKPFTGPTIVDRYVLYRAAELTKLHGYDYFKVIDLRPANPGSAPQAIDAVTGQPDLEVRGEPISVRRIRLYHGQPPPNDESYYSADRLLHQLAPYIER